MRRLVLWMAAFVPAVALMGLSGCSNPSPRTELKTPSADRALSQARRCDAPSDRPFVVEWAAADRAQLEARLGQEVAVVARDGCGVRVLPRCSTGTAYDFYELSPKSESVSIRSANELYTQLPMGAARLEGALARSGELVVDMAVRGRFELHAGAPVLLSGQCEGATHLLTGATVGAFELSASASRQMRGEAQVPIAGLPVGGGASHEAGRELLSRDGDLQRCSDGQLPLEGCRALVQIELGPLPPQAVAATAIAESQPTAIQLQRRARAWRGTATAAGVTAGLSLGGVIAGSVLLSQADWDEMSTPVWEEPGPEVAEKKRIGTAVLTGSLVGTASMTALWLGARSQARRLEGRALNFGAMANGHGAMFSVSGRF